MKAWTAPKMENLNIQATAYAPDGGHRVDGVYQSTDGRYQMNTYAPSGSNSGTPDVNVR